MLFMGSVRENHLLSLSDKWEIFVNIVLIGYHRCGKTSVGQKLASQLWKTFVNADNAEQLTPELMGIDDQVITVGSDVLMHVAARQLIDRAEHTKRIYLQCEPPQLMRRCEAGGKSSEEVAQIETILAEREPVYLAVADHVLDVTNLDPEDTVRYLIHQFL